MKPIKGKVFIVAESINEMQERKGSIIQIADMGTINTSAPYTGRIYAVAEGSEYEAGQRVMFEKGVGLKIDTSDFCEHKELLVMRESDIWSVVGEEVIEVKTK